jgi:hypothetical protein
MPSWELFDAQPQSYRDDVLPPKVSARLAAELGVTQGWHRYVGDRDDVLGVERSGASAPADILLREYGFTIYDEAARAQAAGRLMHEPHLEGDPGSYLCYKPAFDALGSRASSVAASASTRSPMCLTVTSGVGYKLALTGSSA